MSIRRWHGTAPPHTGRARLGYDRARVMFKKCTATAPSGGLEFHQLRHSAATHLGDQKIPLQLVMAKTRHKSPPTAMPCVRPGDAAVAEVTSLLGPTPAQPLSRAAPSGQPLPLEMHRDPQPGPLLAPGAEFLSTPQRAGSPGSRCQLRM